ncbi:MAG: hypothetical protein FJ271_28330 [Planctomycetes bacterium]|nr:hypothetical protein [Planctomycetota bacterium]
MTPTLRRWIRGCSLFCGLAAFLLVTIDSGFSEALFVTPLALIAGGLCGAIAGAFVDILKTTRLGQRLTAMPKWIALSLAVTLLLLLGVLWYLRPWDPIGPLGYHRVELGMAEAEVGAILGDPDKEYRRSRHIGGITSPGVVTVLKSEVGLPFEDLPTRYGEKARNGLAVTLKQWWGSQYTIDVAFNDNGSAVGIYLMTFRKVN